MQKFYYIYNCIIKRMFHSRNTKINFFTKELMKFKINGLLINFSLITLHCFHFIQRREASRLYDSLFLPCPFQFPQILHLLLFQEPINITKVFLNLLVAKFENFADQSIQEIPVVRYQYKGAVVIL